MTGILEPIASPNSPNGGFNVVCTIPMTVPMLCAQYFNLIILIFVLIYDLCSCNVMIPNCFEVEDKNLKLTGFYYITQQATAVGK